MKLQTMKDISPYNRIRGEIDALAEFLSAIETEDETTFDEGFLYRLHRINELSELVPDHRGQLMKYCFEVTGRELDSSIIMRRAREKPLGYAGDYRLIDWIYKNRPFSTDKGRFFDRVFLKCTASQSVRNRKDFLVKRLLSHHAHSSRTFLLNMACGPCREILEAMQFLYCNGPSDYTFYTFHCIDQDYRAIAYVKGLFNGDLSDSFEIIWETANVFRIRPKQKYGLIWSSGLFDYLDDRLAIALIRRMWRWLDEGGQIVIGNFHPNNPSKNQMEWCLGWFLKHRTEDDMAGVCNSAGIPTDCISFEFEPLGINMFLIIEKG